MTEFIPEPFGKYTLTRRIAKGGMAEIFLASQRGPAGFEKELVVKKILPHLASDDAFITMFLDEARLAARLAHPNCVQIYELGEHAGAYYIAMEYVRGPNLSTVIRKLREHGLRMPLHYAAWIVARAAAGLDFAHSMTDERGQPLGLVHRDISPDNILVTEQGAVKMIDFGVAKAQTNETKTIAGTIKGKLRYMSPEQVQGKHLDGRSDLFSLGIVLYELTTLQRPFGGTSELATVSAIITDPPESPSRVVDGYPPPLEVIVERALSKDPAQRFATAHEMQDALEAFVHTRGAYLTDREVGGYLARLFSATDQDLQALRDLPSGLHTAIRPELVSEAKRRAAGPAPGGGTTGPAPGGGTTGPADAPKRRPLGAILAAGVIVLLAAAAAVWLFVLAPEGGPGGAVGGADAGTVAAARDAGPAPRRRPPEGVGTERGDPESAADAGGGTVAGAPTPDAGGSPVAVASVDAGGPAAGPDVPGPAVGPDVPGPAAGPDVPPVAVAADVPGPSAGPDVSPGVAAADVPPAVAAGAPDVPPVTAPVDVPKVTPPPVEKQVGWLIVRGPPNSTVIIGGRSYGARVNEKIALRPGRYEILLHLPARSGTRKATARVEAGETLKVAPH
jgi:serine/threonine-protein kinase